MGKIVALGGGEIGRPGHPVETTAIDEEIIRLSGKDRPGLLFIPTATDDSEIYIETVRRHFGERLGCKIDTLRLVSEKPRYWEIQVKVSKADIIYAGGGNTLKMLRIWRKTGLDKVLIDACEKGQVLSGISAGAICWFRYGSSDPKKYVNPYPGPVKSKGLNLVRALFCPHYDIEPYRKQYLKKLMEKTAGVAIAVENCCAVEIIDGNYRIITSKDGPNAYKVYWSRGIYHEEIIEQKEEFSPLKDLLGKS